MSEMVERVARALYTDCGDGMGNLPYEAARTAIAAMRDPLSEMIATGGRLSHMKDPTLQNLNAMAIYRAMIDTALTP